MIAGSRLWLSNWVGPMAAMLNMIIPGELVAATYDCNFLGHDWGAWVTVTPPTYTTHGLAWRNCQRTSCDMYQIQALPPLGDDAIG